MTDTTEEKLRRAAIYALTTLIAALRAKDERIAELEGALSRCAEIVERNNHRQNEKVDDVKLIARRTLAKQEKPA